MKYATTNLLVAMALLAAAGCRPDSPPAPSQQPDAPAHRQPFDDPLMVRLAAGTASQPDAGDPGQTGNSHVVGTVDEYIARRLAGRLDSDVPLAGDGNARPARNGSKPGDAETQRLLSDSPGAPATQPGDPLTRTAKSDPATQPQDSSAGELIGRTGGRPEASPSRSPLLAVEQSAGGEEGDEPARLVMPAPGASRRPPLVSPVVGSVAAVSPAATQPTPDAVMPAVEMSAAPLSSAALNVSGRVFTGDEILRPIWGELDRLAGKATPQSHRPQAVALIGNELRLAVAEHLVSQEAEKAMSDEARQNVDKALNERLEERARAMYGGSMRLLKQAWAHQGLDPEKEIVTARRQMLVQAYMREKFMPQIHVVRPEAYAYYQKHMSEFSQDAKVRLKVITILPAYPDKAGLTREERLAAEARARERAGQVRDMIRSGKVTFDKAAQDYSDGYAGGDLGLITRGGLRTKKVEEAAFALPVGQTSDVIEETLDGNIALYIVTVTEAIPLKVVPFSEAVNTIIPALERQKFSEQSSAYMQKLYQQAGIDEAQFAKFIEDAYKVVPKPKMRDQ